MAPPELLTFPFTEAENLVTAIEDLKTKLDNLVQDHGDAVDVIRGRYVTGSSREDFGMPLVFSGAAREAFDTLFDDATDAVSGLATDLGTDLSDLEGTLEDAYIERDARLQEREEYFEEHPDERPSPVPPRPQRAPEAPLGETQN